jgi:hypothetical protein
MKYCHVITKIPCIIIKRCLKTENVDGIMSQNGMLEIFY